MTGQGQKVRRVATMVPSARERLVLRARNFVYEYSTIPIDITLHLVIVSALGMENIFSETIWDWNLISHKTIHNNPKKKLYLFLHGCITDLAKLEPGGRSRPIIVTTTSQSCARSIWVGCSYGRVESLKCMAFLDARLWHNSFAVFNCQTNMLAYLLKM